MAEVLSATKRFAPLRPDEIAGASSPTTGPWEVISPPPRHHSPPSESVLRGLAPHGFRFDGLFMVRDRAGGFLYGEIRFVSTKSTPPGKKPEKTYRPVSLCRHAETGRLEFRSKAPPAPRALFGLPSLAKPGFVLVTEGARKAEAAGGLFLDLAAVSATCGADGPSSADWAPLKGQDVIVWPDNDATSRERFVPAVVRGVTAAGATSVRIVQVPKSWPHKWDLADPIPAGATVETLRRMIETAVPIEMALGLSAQSDWKGPEPIVSTLPPVEPFCPELLPDPIRAYVFDVAERQQSPVDFVTVAALTGLAALVGNRFRIRPKRNDDWEIVPNLWGAIIGRPSAMKSPAMRSALAPVYAIQDEMRTTWEGDQRVAKVEEALDALDLKVKRKDAEKAMKTGDREAAREFLVAFGEDDEEVPCPRLIINDATVEKLGELLNENPTGLLLVRDELPGWLARMQKEEFQSERAFYLEAFNGDCPFTYDRIGRGTVHIAHTTLSLVGGVQPSRIAPLVRSALDGTSDDGLIQRLQLTVWPEDRTDWRWTDRRPDPIAREAYEKVFRFLRDLPIGSPAEPVVLRFSDAAQALFRAWMEEIQKEARSGQLSGAVESHLLKMPKTVASLALLFEMIDGGVTEVSEAATIRALGWADYLRSHANRLYAAGETMAENGARLIVERRDQLPEAFTARHVHQKGWAGLADRDAVAAAIDVLLSTHHVRELPVGSGAGGGRPTTSYEWNPAIERET